VHTHTALQTGCRCKLLFTPKCNACTYQHWLTLAQFVERRTPTYPSGVLENKCTEEKINRKNKSNRKTNIHDTRKFGFMKINSEWKGTGYSNAKQALFSKCVICHFKYFTGLHIHLLQIQSHCYKSNHTATSRNILTCISLNIHHLEKYFQ
jgi:hypothetical protein